MALECRCVSNGDPSTYTLMQIATCARTRARTHRRRRRAQRPHMRRRPTVRSLLRCAAGPEAAHTLDNVVTRAVFHAPMSALKADAELNACEPSSRRSAEAWSACTRWGGCGRAQAHPSAAPPRTTAAHASTTDRAQSAAVRAGPEAAHTESIIVTRAVFHAPMFALNTDAEANACEPRTRRSAAA